MGGKIDHAKNNGCGPYTFVLSGLNYHHIGSLLHENGAKLFTHNFTYMTPKMKLKIGFTIRRDVIVEELCGAPQRIHELHAGRLFQQFVVDAYTMIEAQRLLWVRTHQKELRADMYQGLSDALISGERNASTIGKRIILPSSFLGGARYMIRAYQDAMTICRFLWVPRSIHNIYMQPILA
ncbi:hypothetical protein K1719_022484 [Acacia pycnantha]|nr:hypothetical protein K1719_022484 [Acacia pycnantha]